METLEPCDTRLHRIRHRVVSHYENIVKKRDIDSVQYSDVQLDGRARTFYDDALARACIL